MDDSATYTADEFLDIRLELPDAGRWTELNQGKIINLDPPDIGHGTIVLNISKVLSVYLHKVNQGYACFDLGLLVKRDPDTVRFPAVSLFNSGNRFEETDKTVSERKPDAVIEIASTNPRRKSMPGHIKDYVSWGIDLIWVIDPDSREVLEYQPGKESEVIDVQGKLTGKNVLPGFVMPVKDLFAEPDWW
ncbi:Uma2 family endonuclease [Gimesia sp.]|uniref:Uma2 family endonuclease n=1 Tax=Gimesia sp. TaxID=2024833 RepID=UPI003A8E0DD3